MENRAEAFLRLKSSFFVNRKCPVFCYSQAGLSVFMYVLFHRDCLKDDLSLSYPSCPPKFENNYYDTGIFLNQRALRSTKVLSLYM